MNFLPFAVVLQPSLFSVLCFEIACETRRIYGLIITTFLSGNYFEFGIAPKITIIKYKFPVFEKVPIKNNEINS